MKVQGEFKFLGVEKGRVLRTRPRHSMLPALPRDWIPSAVMWMRRHMVGIPVLNLIPM